MLRSLWNAALHKQNSFHLDPFGLTAVSIARAQSSLAKHIYEAVDRRIIQTDADIRRFETDLDKERKKYGLQSSKVGEGVESSRVRRTGSVPVTLRQCCSVCGTCSGVWECVPHWEWEAGVLFTETAEVVQPARCSTAWHVTGAGGERR